MHCLVNHGEAALTSGFSSDNSENGMGRWAMLSGRHNLRRSPHSQAGAEKSVETGRGADARRLRWNELSRSGLVREAADARVHAGSQVHVTLDFGRTRPNARSIVQGPGTKSAMLQGRDVSAALGGTR